MLLLMYLIELVEKIISLLISNQSSKKAHLFLVPKIVKCKRQKAQSVNESMFVNRANCRDAAS